MIKAIDTFYYVVKNRVRQKNAGRAFEGIMEAQDWPPAPQVFDAFYLLVLGEAPLGRQAYSAAIPVVVHLVQWVWINQGTDVQAGVQGRSRGDRYRTNQRMKEELLFGLYPYFAAKDDISVTSQGVLLVEPTAPAESFVWSPGTFVTKSDKPSGLIYGSASVRITDMTEEIVDVIQP